MGFPSPARDYIESRINLNDLFIHHPSATIRVDTPDGFLLVDRAEAIKPGDRIAFQHMGYSEIGKVYRHSIITPDGEALEGEALKEVIVIGKVTLEVKALHADCWPGI